MHAMFSECTSLADLPDISIWNINPEDNYEAMFYRCDKLTRPYYSSKLIDFIKENNSELERLKIENFLKNKNFS